MIKGRILDDAKFCRDFNPCSVICGRLFYLNNLKTMLTHKFLVSRVFNCMHLPVSEFKFSFDICDLLLVQYNNMYSKLSENGQGGFS